MASDYDPEWLKRHLAQERRQAGVLSEIREAVFGAQDGLTSGSPEKRKTATAPAITVEVQKDETEAQTMSKKSRRDVC